MAEYQGRKVELNKPMRGDVKKFKVYTKDPKSGNVKKVNFGSKEMEIKRDDPDRRKSFRARHKCDQAKDKTTPKYWSCKMWGKKKVSDLVDSLVFDPESVMDEDVQSSALLDEAVALGMIKKSLVQNNIDFKDIFQKSGKVFISFFREKIADRAEKILKAYGFGDFSKRKINDVIVLASASPIEESLNSLVFEQEEIDPDFIEFDFPSITEFETTGLGGIKAVVEGEIIDSDNDASYPITVALQGYYQAKEPDVGIMSSGFVANRIDVISNPTSIPDSVLEDKLVEYEWDFGSMSESVKRIKKDDSFEKAYRNYGNRLKGGKADGRDPSEFDINELRMGFKVEFEHTNDPDLAFEITMDHLTEIPDYYTRLKAGVEA